MSRVSDAKARQGYRQQGRHCEECAHVRRNGIWTSGRIGNVCSIGGFAVKARATCDSWVENGSLLAAMQESP